MFSSKKLISFVFANEGETYYEEGLLKLNLNQYLWTQLHKSYDAVYFLGDDGGTFSVRTFGDQYASEYTLKKKKLSWFGGSDQQEQGNWLLQQLRGKSGKTAAFVCPLEDFCSVLEHEDWTGTLKSIAAEKKRSGIFVLTTSATAEHSKDLLLKSDVFQKLQETDVTDLRGGALRNLYGDLKENKGDNCLFLNTFNWERVRTLLQHLFMKFPERLDSLVKQLDGSHDPMDLLTDFLHAWLRDPDAVGEVLLPQKLPVGYLTYKEVFDRLCNERTWQRLEKQSLRFAAQYHQSTSSQSVIPVLRDPNSYAGKCMRLRIPSWAGANEELAEQAEDLLRSIQKNVCVPKNREENKQITDAAASILQQFSGIREKDFDTLIQELRALKFCVDQVYVDKDDETCGEIMEIIKTHQKAINFSDQCFSLRRELNRSKNYAISGDLQALTLQKMEAQLFSLEKMHRTCCDLISARELGLFMPGSSEHIDGLMADLEQQTQAFNDPKPKEPERQPLKDSDPEPKKPDKKMPEPEEEFVPLELDSLYDFIPPV